MGGKDGTSGTQGWLNEESIRQLLEEAVNRIRNRNLTGALDTLIYLNFEQLLFPSKDQRTLLLVDRAHVFGVDRVRETGEQIRACEAAIQASDADRALEAGKAALARWNQT